MVMTDFNDTEVKKRKKFPVSLIILIIGVVMLVVGIILYNAMDMNKYFKTNPVNEEFDGDKITTLDIDYGAGQLTIEKSDDNKIHVEGEASEDYLSIGTDGDTFRVSTKSLNWWGNFRFFNFGSSEKNYLTIYLPEKTYSDLMVNIGAGETTINNVNCENGDFSFGAGKVTFNSVTISDTADFECGAGQVIYNDCIINKGSFDCGVGQLDYNGIINGDTKIDCGVGQVNFNLQGDESNYKLRGDMSNSTNSSDAIEIKVSKGIGDTNIRFGQNFGL